MRYEDVKTTNQETIAFLPKSIQNKVFNSKERPKSYSSSDKDFFKKIFSTQIKHPKTIGLGDTADTIASLAKVTGQVASAIVVDPNQAAQLQRQREEREKEQSNTSLVLAGAGVALLLLAYLLFGNI